MTGILDPPVRPDSPGKELGVVLDAFDEVPAFRGGLPFAGHLRDHGADGFKFCPLFGIGEAIQKGGCEIRANLMAAMTVLFCLVEIKVRAIQIFFLCLAEGLLNRLEQGALVALESRDVIASLLYDLPGDSFLAAHCIDGHYASRDVEHFEQFGNGGDFIGLFIGFHLP